MQSGCVWIIRASSVLLAALSIERVNKVRGRPQLTGCLSLFYLLCVVVLSGVKEALVSLSSCTVNLSRKEF